MTAIKQLLFTLVLLIPLFSAASCDPHRDYCFEAVECMDGNDRDVDACIVQMDASKNRASAFGCDETFEVMAACAEQRQECHNEKPDLSECRNDLEAHARCLEDSTFGIFGDGQPEDQASPPGNTDGPDVTMDNPDGSSPSAAIALQVIQSYEKTSPNGLIVEIKLDNLDEEVPLNAQWTHFHLDRDGTGTFETPVINTVGTGAICEGLVTKGASLSCTLVFKSGPTEFSGVLMYVEPDSGRMAAALLF